MPRRPSPLALFKRPLDLVLISLAFVVPGPVAEAAPKPEVERMVKTLTGPSDDAAFALLDRIKDRAPLDPDALPALIKAFEVDKHSNRTEAIGDAIAAVAQPLDRIMAELIRLWIQTDETEAPAGAIVRGVYTRDHIAHVLMRLGKAAVPALVAQLPKPPKSRRTELALLVLKLDPGCAPARAVVVAAFAAGDLREPVLTALKDERSVAALPAIRARLGELARPGNKPGNKPGAEVDEDQVWALLGILERLGTKAAPALPEVLPWLKPKDTRQMACRVLRMMDVRSAEAAAMIRPLLTIPGTRFGDNQRPMFVECVHALLSVRVDDSDIGYAVDRFQMAGAEFVERCRAAKKSEAYVKGVRAELIRWHEEMMVPNVGGGRDIARWCVKHASDPGSRFGIKARAILTRGHGSSAVALDHLAGVLKQGEQPERIAAAATLLSFRGDLRLAAFEAVRARLMASKGAELVKLTELVGNQNADLATPVLWELRGDPNPAVRAMVLRKLTYAEPRKDGLALRRLADPDAAVRLLAVEWVRRGPAASTALFALQAKDEDQKVRKAAFEALVTFDDPALVPLFTAALDDPARREKALEALSRLTIADPAAVKALAAVWPKVKGERWLVGKLCLALAKMRPTAAAGLAPETKAALIERLEDGALRFNGAPAALRKLAPEKTKDYLARYRKDPDGGLLWLGCCGQATPELLDTLLGLLLSKDTADYAGEVLALHAEAAPELLKRLKETDRPKVQRRAAEVLATMGPRGEKALPELHRLLSAKAASTQRLAGFALGRLAGTDPNAARLFPKATPDAIQGFFEGIVHSGEAKDLPQTLLPVIGSVLKDGERFTWKAVAAALQTMPALSGPKPPRVGLAKPWQSHANEAVRDAIHPSWLK